MDANMDVQELSHDMFPDMEVETPPTRGFEGVDPNVICSSAQSPTAALLGQEEDELVAAAEFQPTIGTVDQECNDGEQTNLPLLNNLFIAVNLAECCAMLTDGHITEDGRQSVLHMISSQPMEDYSSFLPDME